MRMSRRAGLYGSNKPTFAELFATGNITFIMQTGRNSTSTGSITYTPSQYYTPSGFVASKPCYLFFTAGGSFEVSRINWSQVGTTVSFSRTLIKNSTPSGQTAYYTSISSDGKSITSDAVYSGNMTLLQFRSSKYTQEVVDMMFSEANYHTPKYYYSSTLTDADADLRVGENGVTQYDGVIISSFRDLPSGGTAYDTTAASVFYVASTQNPTKDICSITSPDTEDGRFYGIHMKEVTSSGSSYLIPTGTGQYSDTNARVRSYTLKTLGETW